jgi:alpha-amylase/alpha-mannosidase (GH57 family)
MYEFVNDLSSMFLTIEEWQDEDKEEYRIYISKPVEPAEITLISRGRDNP